MLPLPTSKPDAPATVAEILLNLGPSFKHSPVELVHQVATGIKMDCFPGALAQILSNLVLNGLLHAFEDGAAGQIEVLASRRPAMPEVEITVRDNGSGIAAQHGSRVFDPFYTTRRNQGGTITLHSTVGVGTSFVLRIPCIAPQHVPHLD